MKEDRRELDAAIRALEAVARVAYTNGPEGPNLCEYLGGEWRPS